MKEAFKIGAIEAERAKTTLTRLQCSEYADGTPLTIPLVVVHGADPGPVLFLKGCQHGDEVIGALIAREVAATVDPTTLRGTLLIVPIANVPAFLTRSRGFSLEERDLSTWDTRSPATRMGLSPTGLRTRSSTKSYSAPIM